MLKNNTAIRKATCFILFILTINLIMFMLASKKLVFALMAYSLMLIVIAAFSEEIHEFNIWVFAAVMVHRTLFSMQCLASSRSWVRHYSG
jgi:hypothetical protein